jgi:tRNA (guanine-N7-)-methyltransferase
MTDDPKDAFRDRPLRSFGRTGGRALSPRQQRLFDTQLGNWRLPSIEAGPVDLASLFPDAGEVWLEIGFGGGEHLAAQAVRRPDTGFIGCEPFVEGVAKALGAIEENGLSNIRLWTEDARPLIDALPEASIARAFILFPDPWPKRRQQKRRLIQPAFIAALHRILAPGAAVRFATDVASYANDALLVFLSHGGFHWTAQRADDWRLPPADHVTTRYETKRLGDCAPVWFDFIRS